MKGSFIMQTHSTSLQAGPGSSRGLRDRAESPTSHVTLDPSRVRIWPGNPRDYTLLHPDKCRDLIDSMIAVGGQQVPVVLRRVYSDPDFDFEVIAGTRRHYAVSWLRANGYPHLQFSGMVHQLTDEEAFLVADLENRNRQDISDIERARNYAVALHSHYGGNQSRMADRLRLSKGWLSKMLTVATVPDAVLAAFDDLATVSLAALYSVATMLSKADAAKAIAQRAVTIAAEQGQRRNAGLGPIAAPEVIRLLKSAVLPARKQFQPFEAKSRYGLAMLSVTASGRLGVTLRLHSHSGARREEVVQALEEALDWLQSQGKGRFT
jgi:ParB family transcriptional regulator, chromosome partitioning protein